MPTQNVRLPSDFTSARPRQPSPQDHAHLRRLCRHLAPNRAAMERITVISFFSMGDAKPGCYHQTRPGAHRPGMPREGDQDVWIGCQLSPLPTCLA